MTSPRGRDVTAADVLADKDLKAVQGPDLPQWMCALRELSCTRLAVALGASVRLTCPKCGAVTMVATGTTWRCTDPSCGRHGDPLDLVSRALHGKIYFRLTTAERQSVRQWSERYLKERSA